MKTIHKFPLRAGYAQTLELPLGAKVLCVQEQRGVPTLWVELDPDAEKRERMFTVYGTGWELFEGHPEAYIGTVQEDGYVWHVYEVL